MVLCNGVVRIVGQLVSLQKSSDKGVHRRIRRRVSRFLAVQHGSLPMKYLGTMDGINQLRMSEIEPLPDRVRVKLNTWKATIVYGWKAGVGEVSLAGNTDFSLVC